MANEQVIEDRVLTIFEGSKELMAEEVFPLYEERFGDTSRSNSIHTTISRLTKKGLLFVVRRQTSPLTKKTVNVWKVSDGSVQPVVDEYVKPTSSAELRNQVAVLEIKNKNLEAQVMDLLGKLEVARAGK